jgi:hypothetical protein
MTQPRIAVITPYHREPVELLTQCHESVIGQDVVADHFMIADGHPLDLIDEWRVHHVRLPQAHDDYGDTPRGIGSLLASRDGYDFIAYLDADNWYHGGHLRSLLGLWEEKNERACASFRTFHDRDGHDLGIQEPAEDALRHIDTSCLLIHRSGFDCLSVWLDMPKMLAPIGDRVFLAGMLHRNFHIVCTGARTVAYRTQWSRHYQSADRPVPKGAKDDDVLQPAFQYLASSEGISQCIHALGFWPPTYLK